MKQDRREFIKKSGCALGMAALATQIEHFGMMTALAQQADDSLTAAPPSDYRALVCVFMAGGNDGNNTIIPNHSSATVSNYQTYFDARNPASLAIPQAQLLPITVPRMGGLTYGLNPNLGALTQNGTSIVNNGIHELWAQGKMAAVTNVGTLIKHLTRAQYQANLIPRPYQLFSHSDQVNQYQGGRSDIETFTGWGGRISDLRTTADNPNGLVPMITSISGAQLFTAGQLTLPLAIAGAGTSLASVLNPAGFNTTSASQARLTAFNQLRTQDLTAKYVSAASHITDQAIQANQALQTSQEVTVTFPNTGFGSQLKQVARLIKKRTDLTVNRQIFYVQIGGFDTHTGQIAGQGGLHLQFSQGVRAFYDEMVAQGISDKVTLFSMTDFSRTFNPAGSGSNAGSDHAWANHLFVVGGAVQGGDFYGNPSSTGTPFPNLTMNGPDDADSGTSARGRWIPSTSVEEYAATLARWYGLPEDKMSTVFPNYANFVSPNTGNTNLGFLPAP